MDVGLIKPALDSVNDLFDMIRVNSQFTMANHRLVCTGVDDRQAELERS